MKSSPPPNRANRADRLVKGLQPKKPARSTRKNPLKREPTKETPFMYRGTRWGWGYIKRKIKLPLLDQVFKLQEQGEEERDRGKIGLGGVKSFQDTQ